MRRKQFTFYSSYYDAIRQLKKADQLATLMAICAYAIDEQEPELSGSSAAAFMLVRPTLDASRKKSENGKKGGKQKASKNESNEKQSVSKSEANNKQTESEYESEEENEKEVENECSLPCVRPLSKAENDGIKGHLPRKKYGEYGWVRLTQEEYDRLLRDLGEIELSRCIRYVDESAQSTGNKNKWSDWNLILRKCSRDRWGIVAYQRPEQGKKAVGHEDAPTDFERDAIRRMMGKTFDDDVPDF